MNTQIILRKPLFVDLHFPFDKRAPLTNRLADRYHPAGVCGRAVERQ